MKVWINKSKNKSEEQLFFEYISATSFEAGATTYATRAITAEQENERLRAALQIVQKWQLPPTGKFWDKEETQPMSYGACYGSNGERDYMKAIANEALNYKSNTANDTVNR